MRTPIVNDDAGGRRGAIAVAAAVLVAVLVAVLTGFASLAPAAAEPDACASMSELVEAGFPSQARDTIDDLDLSCSDARLAATGRIKAAQAEAEAAELADVDGRRGKIDAAIGFDRDNHLAQKLLAELPDETSSGSQRLNSWWTNFYEQHVAALKDVGIAVAIYAVAVIVLARLMLLGRGPLRPAWLWRRRWPSVTAILAAAAGIWLLASSSAGAFGLLVGAGQLLLFLGATAVLASALVAWWNSRPALGVEVRSAGAVDGAATGLLIATIGDLGANPPKGLEYAIGSDGDTLENASIDGVPASALFTFVLTVVRLLSAPSGWKVNVDKVDDGSWAVAITRNRRDLQSALVAASDIPLSTGTATGADMQAMVAAFVVSAVAPRDPLHTHVIDWRSVGLHYIATVNYSADQPNGKQLLLESLRIDANNLDAVVALRWSQCRSAKDQKGLLAYRNWLADMAFGPLKDEQWKLLRRRVQYTMLLIACNAQVHDGVALLDDVDNDAVWAQVEDFQKWVSTASTDPRLERIRRPMEITSLLALQCLCRFRFNVPGANTFTMDPTALSPREHYQYACFLAYGHHVLSSEQTAMEAAVRHLVLGSFDPEVDAERSEDPWLKVVRKSTAYEEAFPAAKLRPR